MPKNITLTETDINKIEIIQDDNGVVQVVIFYELNDDVGNRWANKAIQKFSSDSGLPAGQLMPDAWATKFRELLADLKTKLNKFEQLA